MRYVKLLVGERKNQPERSDRLYWSGVRPAWAWTNGVTRLRQGYGAAGSPLYVTPVNKSVDLLT